MSVWVWPNRPWRVLVMASVVGAGCHGNISKVDEASSSDDADPDRRLAPDPSCRAPNVEAKPLARLTAGEYQRTVSALVERDPGLSFPFAADEEAGGYAVGTGLPALLVEQYFNAAEEIAGRIVAEDLNRIVPCAATGADRACAASFIESFGPRAFRRPITAEEKQTYLAQYEVGAEVDFATGIEAVIFSFLASPKFLYHLESSGAGTGPGQTGRLDPYALANRLSYFLWASMPDDDLFRAAEEGLDDAALEAQARRMIADPRAAVALRDFASQWLQLGGLATVERDAEVYPEFRPDLLPALEESALRFVEEVFRGPQSQMGELFVADYLFVDAELATLFDLDSAPANGMSKVAADPAQRRGILTHPAILTIHARARETDPVGRGVFIRERVLCQELPPPPDNVAIDIPPPEPNESNRARFARHATDPSCRGCHQLIDPLGFGFEHYDALGRWRAVDNGQPIDARGEVLSTSETDGPFDGATELAERFAQSGDVSTCVATQLFRYAMGRVLTEFDECSMRQIAAGFEASGYDLRELMVAIVRSDAFANFYVEEGAAL